MVRVARPFALVVFASAALFVAGCGKSANEGKIVGKWKFVDFPAGVQGAEELKQAALMGIYLYCEFKPNNTFELGAGSDNPQMAEMIQGKAGATAGGKYKLLSGEGVEFYDLPKEFSKGGGGMFGNKDRARTKIKIEGDNMTWSDDDGKTAKLARVGANAPATGAAGAEK